MRKVIYILILSTIALMGISIKNYSNKDVETGSLQSSYEDYEDLIIKYGNKNEKIVALTFDDGPDEDFTPQILDILKKYNVKATFYVIGEKVQYNKKIIKREYEEGHEIGNHSDTHPHVNNLSLEKNIEEIQNCNNKIEQITGKKTTLYRGPYGEYNNTVINAAKSQNLTTIQWNLDTLDYTRTNRRRNVEKTRK